MVRYAQLVTIIFIDKYQGAFEVLNSSVDVGGRTGALGKAIADAFLHLECSPAFDLSRVVHEKKIEEIMEVEVGNDIHLVRVLEGGFKDDSFIMKTVQKNGINA
ncbi:hypothetical protein V6N11_044998 [Hibiscus sabdariffa]|uniref:O-methyltransferase C-terminal domain-containing protein n=1 Tax=Hibiscus sabdariffa TaxID=183260 RepID=A0ABR2PUG6_9ROSI